MKSEENTSCNTLAGNEDHKMDYDIKKLPFRHSILGREEGEPFSIRILYLEYRIVNFA
jgi:hypothetical protein